MRSGFAYSRNGTGNRGDDPSHKSLRLCFVLNDCPQFPEMLHQLLIWEYRFDCLADNRPCTGA